MCTFNELWYPITRYITPTNIPDKFQSIWKIFVVLSQGQAWPYERKGWQTDSRADAGNDNTP